jgi:propanol-preferring alcohol dehydrogenase
MKAILVEEFKKRPQVKEVSEPKIRGPFDALVRIHASGVCHTDLHAADGDWPVKPVLPFIPGHEGVGIVEEVGALVTNIRPGDRVGIPWLYSACGECGYCLTGWETLCESQHNTGYSVNGGFAEWALADARYVGKIPEGLEFADVAPHFCAGVTTYKAVKVSGAGPDKTVLISGVGGLGHMALQYARVTGARTIAVDVTEEKLELAKKLGADEVINARAVDVAQAAQKLGGADVIIGTACFGKGVRGRVRRAATRRQNGARWSTTRSAARADFRSGAQGYYRHRLNRGHAQGLARHVSVGCAWARQMQLHQCADGRYQ